MLLHRPDLVAIASPVTREAWLVLHRKWAGTDVAFYVADHRVSRVVESHDPQHLLKLMAAAELELWQTLHSTRPVLAVHTEAQPAERSAVLRPRPWDGSASRRGRHRRPARRWTDMPALLRLYVATWQHPAREGDLGRWAQAAYRLRTRNIPAVWDAAHGPQWRAAG